MVLNVSTARGGPISTAYRLAINDYNGERQTS